jgi:hypothetical protein
VSAPTIVEADVRAREDAGNMERVIQKREYPRDPTMCPRRVRFTIWGLMIAVLAIVVMDDSLLG